MPSQHASALAVPVLLCALTSLSSLPASAQNENQQNPPSKASPRLPSPEEQLQLTINNAGNDRAALVRNLEAYLKQFPDSHQRPQIYRALVEACMQLKDDARAAGYAERIVALNPDDISMTILTIQLLERTGDESALRRATGYATRVLEFVESSSSGGKSPKISQEDWALEKNRDRMSVLALRGRLELKLKDTVAAQKDLEASYAVLPGATAAEQLGEIAELKKDLNGAIQQYARAFALADAASRREIRQKLGNVWRLAHGSDVGLGEYLLLTFDEVSKTSASSTPRKNTEAREPSEFMLRKAPEGTPYPLNVGKGKVLVVNFWATWCGPCHALEPIFARVAANFLSEPDALFLAADCDEDESLVKGYLEEHQPHTMVVFADGLDRFFSVNSFPTVLVLDRAGKIAYRSNGFDADSFGPDLMAAVRRALAPLSASSPDQKPAP
ncbi:MAG TPA: TlpA disulfide reductase family protein [Candidatus Cybelea sp.]|nr:TlpA disulfide reductase family protein [Candidatus Cybelea sp.]